MTKYAIYTKCFRNDGIASAEEMQNGMKENLVGKTEAEDIIWWKMDEHHHQSIKMFYESGGKMAMGTDAGTPFNVHGDNSQELQYMVDLGISNSDALKISTANAADLMGMEHRGQIREGDFADLLIVSGNPLEDISAVADRGNHRSIVKNGLISSI